MGQPVLIDKGQAMAIETNLPATAIAGQNKVKAI
jgi:hypothetical protein